VVELLEMAELVDDDIVEVFFRKKNYFII